MSPGPSSGFHEILLEGNPERCHGLLSGLVIGTRSGAFLVFSHDVAVRTPLGERLLELVHLHAAVCHVIADEEGRRLLKSFSADLEREKIRVLEEKPIRSGRFTYEYHAYARKYGDEIRELLQALPGELRHEGEDPTETLRDGAEGMEAYSPVHEYEVESRGAVSGSRMDLLIEARAALDEHPLVNASRIELELKS